MLFILNTFILKRVFQLHKLFLCSFYAIYNADYSGGLLRKYVQRCFETLHLISFTLWGFRPLDFSNLFCLFKVWLWLQTLTHIIGQNWHNLHLQWMQLRRHLHYASTDEIRAITLRNQWQHSCTRVQVRKCDMVIIRSALNKH